MDDVDGLATDLDERMYREKSRKGEIKYRDPASKTSRTARSISRQNARRNSEMTDEEVIRHDLTHFLNEARENEDLISGLVSWILGSVEKQGVVFDENTIVCHYSRSGGAGGQFTNKRETSVLCVHKPSLIQAHCEDTPSQEENRKRAEQNLKLKLENHLDHWFELVRINPGLKDAGAMKSMIEKLIR